MISKTRSTARNIIYHLYNYEYNRTMDRKFQVLKLVFLFFAGKSRTCNVFEINEKFVCVIFNLPETACQMKKMEKISFGFHTRRQKRPQIGRD